MSLVTSAADFSSPNDGTAISTNQQCAKPDAQVSPKNQTATINMT